MIYALLVHDPKNEYRNYFLGMYPSKETALKEKAERKKIYGDQGYFVNEYTNGGRLARVNIED